MADGEVDGTAHGTLAQELGELRAGVAAMGGLAEAAIDRAMEALARRDLAAAARLVADDRRLDGMEAEIERQVVDLIARRRPPEGELRDALAALRIAGVVERIGDYAKNIAKRVPLLMEARGLAPLAALPAMARATAGLVRDALDAYAARDPAAAARVCAQDRAVDDLYNSLFRALLAYMAEHPQDVSAAAHLLFVAKNLERIGDHATNVAEMVHFAATGEQMAERVRGLDALAAA